MATFATLPGELLTAIASYIDTPHVIVAVASDADARAAVRRGVDEAERALRGMSVRGAEAFLLHAYRVPAAALSDRHAAGLVLVEAASGYQFESDIIPTLLAYRALPDVETSSTIDGEVRVAGRALHYVSGSGHERSLLFASLLLDAGADINARCDPGNLAGRPGGRRSRRLADHFLQRRRGSGSKAAREFCSGIARDCLLSRHSARPRPVCWTSRSGTYDCFYGTRGASAFFPSISCPSKTGALTETGGRMVG